MARVPCDSRSFALHDLLCRAAGKANRAASLRSRLHLDLGRWFDLQTGVILGIGTAVLLLSRSTRYECPELQLLLHHMPNASSCLRLLTIRRPWSTYLVRCSVIIANVFHPAMQLFTLWVARRTTFALVQRAGNTATHSAPSFFVLYLGWALLLSITGRNASQAPNLTAAIVVMLNACLVVKVVSYVCWQVAFIWQTCNRWRLNSCPQFCIRYWNRRTACLLHRATASCTVSCIEETASAS